MMTKSELKQVLKLDAYGYGERGAERAMEDAHAFDVAAGCFVVADGVGHGQGGDLAARAVVDQVMDVCAKKPREPVGGALLAALNGLDSLVMMRTAMAMSATAVGSQQSAHGQPCGTTVAALALREGRAFVAWCGDTRVYRLRAEWRGWTLTKWRAARLTRDHRDTRGTLVRNLGNQCGGDSATPEYHETDVQPGDVFALVTAGVWEKLVDEGVCRAMMDSHAGRVAVLTTRWIAEELVHRALELGSRDNLTALVVRVSEEGR